MAFTEINDSNKAYYFIAAHTINGARFFSESFNNISIAAQNYVLYEDLVDYFGGGIVELYYIDEEDFNIVAISRV